MKESITKPEIIRSRPDVRRLFATKYSVRMPYMRAKSCPNRVGHCRVLVTSLGKTRGVVRNAVRRGGKELYRTNKDLLVGHSFDILLQLSKEVLNISYVKRTKWYRMLVSKMIKHFINAV